jgi:hypothetical protein
MAISKGLKTVTDLIRNARVHKVPHANLLTVELRSDGGLDPEEGEPVGDDLPCLPDVEVVWTYDVEFAQFDAFHEFLRDNEADIAADVAALGVKASYLGTYLELPGGNPHRTYWGYGNVKAIDKFKAKLQADKTSDLYKNVQKLIAFAKNPSLTMRRHQRAAMQAGFVRTKRMEDPIIEMLARATGATSATGRARARGTTRRRTGRRRK